MKNSENQAVEADLKPLRFPSFGGLKAFYAVASSGSVVAASKRLGVSASSVSHQLKSLEKEIGVRLLENRKGKLYLTADGQQYYRAVATPLARIHEATEDIRSSAGRRRVSITLTPSVAASWLMPRMRELYALHSDIELKMISTTRVVDLQKENIDIAIRRCASAQAGYKVVPLIDETVVPVISPELWGSIPEGKLSKAFDHTKAIVNTTLVDEWDLWAHNCEVKAPLAKQRFNLETYELAIKAACDGLGIALGRKPLVDPLLEQGELIAPFGQDAFTSIAYSLVYADEALPLPIDQVVEWLLSYRN